VGPKEPLLEPDFEAGAVKDRVIGMHARHQRITIVGVALLASGCFRYVPVELDAAPAGDEVRVELTRVGFAELPELPNNSGPDLNGTLLRFDNDRLFLRVPVYVRLDGLVTQTVQQELAIPAREVVQLERRELSRMRTGLSIGGGLATLGVIFLSFKASDESPEIQQETPEEEAGVGFAPTPRPGWSISIR
jgi:hypothetical protein